MNRNHRKIHYMHEIDFSEYQNHSPIIKKIDICFPENLDKKLLHFVFTQDQPVWNRMEIVIVNATTEKAK